MATKRQLVVYTAQYWYNHAHDESHTMADRLLYMENALNHTENFLAHVLREHLGMTDIAHIDLPKLPKKGVS